MFDIRFIIDEHIISKQGRKELKDRYKMDYKNILISHSGEQITNKNDWEHFRREEIKNLFLDYVYGRAPIGKPDDLGFKIGKIVKNYQEKEVEYNEIYVTFHDFSFKVLGYIPNADAPVPAFVYILHEFEEERTDLFKEPNCEYIPIMDVVSQGYAVFIMPTSGIYPDFENNPKGNEGVFGIFGPEANKRKGNDWSTITAWSWGAQRVMDYIEMDERIDATDVAIAGHSRGGKTALWTAAQDKRFSMVISNASGCMGAAILKGKTGEHVKDINRTSWFCDNFRKYDDREEMLPIDQHMLLALIAPRALYIESCSEDAWSDPKNERLACRLASEVYEKMYGIRGAVLPDEPVEADIAYHKGNIGYHLKTGPHGITKFDWEMYLKFREKFR